LFGAGLCVETKTNQQPFRAPDPIALHETHFVRPAVERIQRVEQFLRIFRDLENPLVHLALFNDRARTPSRVHR